MTMYVDRCGRMRGAYACVVWVYVRRWCDDGMCDDGNRMYVCAYVCRWCMGYVTMVCVSGCMVYVMCRHDDQRRCAAPVRCMRLAMCVCDGVSCACAPMCMRAYVRACMLVRAVRARVCACVCTMTMYDPVRRARLVMCDDRYDRCATVVCAGGVRMVYVRRWRTMSG